MEKTRGNRYKLHREKFYLNIRKIFFIIGTIIHWHNPVRDRVESPSLKVFKMQWTGCQIILCSSLSHTR